ncbi:unnamed protein product [Callosobruchus maculatus]|uniref:Uncharacterized protein n=1 Tax=Callosobruchus maculatus TaxID=64391 RepID=A0A653BDC7_CALMS|nr:unnamed protein product [Callosobruchus maculatus]
MMTDTTASTGRTKRRRYVCRTSKRSSKHSPNARRPIATSIPPPPRSCRSLASSRHATRSNTAH